MWRLFAILALGVCYNVLFEVYYEWDGRHVRHVCSVPNMDLDDVQVGFYFVIGVCRDVLDIKS